MSLHLVTGGAGFIGSHLAWTLADRKHRVRVLDDFSTGRRENLRPDAEVIEGSVTDRAALDRAVAGADTVFHLAALVSVPASVADPRRCHAVNVEGTARLLEAAAAAKVRRVILASSSAVYGDFGDAPAREDQPPRPQSPYAASKLAGEHFARTTAGIESVSLRFFNVYGTRQDPASPYAAVVPIFAAAVEAGRPLPVTGDGDQTRDFVYVADVVSALLLAAEAPGAAGRTYNIGSGRPVSVAGLAHAMGRAAGRPVELEFRPPRPGDIRHSTADVSAAARDLQFRARTPLEEGLAAVIRSLRVR